MNWPCCVCNVSFLIHAFLLNFSADRSKVIWCTISLMCINAVKQDALWSTKSLVRHFCCWGSIVVVIICFILLHCSDNFDWKQCNNNLAFLGDSEWCISLSITDIFHIYIHSNIAPQIFLHGCKWSTFSLFNWHNYNREIIIVIIFPFVYKHTSWW